MAGCRSKLLGEIPVFVTRFSKSRNSAIRCSLLFKNASELKEGVAEALESSERVRQVRAAQPQPEMVVWEVIHGSGQKQYAFLCHQRLTELLRRLPTQHPPERHPSPPPPHPRQI